MYEARRWHNDKRFYTPMIVLDSGEQLFVGDFIKLKEYNIYGKVEKFALEVHIVCSLFKTLIIDMIVVLAEKY